MTIGIFYFRVGPLWKCYGVSLVDVYCWWGTFEFRISDCQVWFSKVDITVMNDFEYNDSFQIDDKFINV